MKVTESEFKNFLAGWVLYDKRTWNLYNPIAYTDDKEVAKAKSDLPEDVRKHIMIMPYKTRLPKKWRKPLPVQTEMFETIKKEEDLSGLLY